LKSNKKRQRDDLDIRVISSRPPYCKHPTQVEAKAVEPEAMGAEAEAVWEEAETILAFLYHNLW
jgi:hypothetical protein